MAHHIDVAVIGAAGPTGRAVMDALSAAGATTRALVHRSPSDGSRDHRVVELADRDSLSAGMEGVRTVHYIPPTYDAAEESYGANVIAAAQRAGAQRLVYHSVLHAPTPAMPHHWRKAKVEMLLRDSPFAWTILQPAMYVQTALAFLSPDHTALIPGFDVGSQFSPIDLTDLAEATARILTEPGHDHATYELAGSERLSFKDMAGVIASVTGRPITARALDPELVLKQAEHRGFAGTALDELRLMMAHYDRHGLVGNGRILTMILGREPTPFAQAVERSLRTPASR
ncbi:SDR family oxidoreductase [Sphingomonas sp.]|uniref:SDR family oxidoreductase n=1 Tax=Sphingomonas sp. TaxID=28214 RepID=UPI0035BBF7DF